MKRQTSTTDARQRRPEQRSENKPDWFIEAVWAGVAQMATWQDERENAARLRENRSRSNAHALAFGYRE